jgi:hypothetical protein
MIKYRYDCVICGDEVIKDKAKIKGKILCFECKRKWHNDRTKLLAKRYRLKAKQRILQGVK